MDIVQETEPDIQDVNFGDFMQEESGIEDRDKMGNEIPLLKYREMQKRVAIKISLISGNQVINTHSAIRTKNGYFPGLPDDIVKILNPDAIIVSEFDPEEIRRRRKGDKKRQGRDKDETTEEIELDQKASLLFAFAAGNAAGCPVEVINLRKPEEEEFGHSKFVAKKIIEIFQAS